MPRALCLIVSLAALAVATGALADEAIPTANDAGATPTERQAPPPLGGQAAAMADDEIIRIGPCGAVQRASDQGPIDESAHGWIDVGVGTGGYRHAGGVVCEPIGEEGSVTVAVDYSQWGRRHRLTGGDWRIDPGGPIASH